MPNAVTRYARVDFRLDRAERTPEGFLQGVVPVTRCGVFPYRNADGTMRYELRTPEEVHKKSHLDSLSMAPVQIEHVAMLDSSNIDQYKVGHLGEKYEVGPLPDGVVKIPIRIDSPKGVAAYDDGKRELSLGYTLNLEEAPPGSTYMGKPYTHIQKDMHVNHIAITDKARLGPDLRLDSAVEVDSQPLPIHQEHPMKKVNIDGIEYDAAPEVINFLGKEKLRADTAEGKVATLTAQMATDKKAFDGEKAGLQAQVDAAKAEKKTAEDALKKLEAEIPTRAAAIAKDRADAMAVAEAVLPTAEVQKLASADSAAIRQAVIKAKYPEIALDGKSAEYFDGLFVAVKAGVKEKGTNASGMNRAASAPVIAADSKDKGIPLSMEHIDGSGKTAAQKREQMAERNRNAYKSPAVGVKAGA